MSDASHDPTPAKQDLHPLYWPLAYVTGTAYGALAIALLLAYLDYRVGIRLF